MATNTRFSNCSAPLSGGALAAAMTVDLAAANFTECVTRAGNGGAVFAKGYNTNFATAAFQRSVADGWNVTGTSCTFTACQAPQGMVR